MYRFLDSIDDSKLESLFSKHGFYANKHENDYTIQFQQFHSFMDELNQVLFTVQNDIISADDDDVDDDDNETNDTELSDKEIKDLVRIAL